jgi:hypothetical protein
VEVVCGLRSRLDVYSERRVRADAESEASLLTPRMRGIKEAGSVDIDASSKKTMGKSMLSMTAEPADKQVVQTCYIVVRY